MKEEKGFATVFSIFMSLLLFIFCGVLVIVASVLNVKHTANHAAEEAALVAASTLDCNRAVEIAIANDSEILSCNIKPDHIYIKTFSRFNNIQLIIFNQLGIYVDEEIGKAKSK
jgi:secretion/DNA translocation related TadE-like protein